MDEPASVRLIHAGLSGAGKLAQIRLGPARACLGTAEQLAAVVALEQVAVEKAGVPGDELIEGRRIACRSVEHDQMDPESRDGLVILVRCAVRTGQVSDCGADDTRGFVDVVDLEVVPHQLQMLAVTEATPRTDDRLKDLEVLLTHSHASLSGTSAYGSIRYANETR